MKKKLKFMIQIRLKEIEIYCVLFFFKTWRYSKKLS